MVPSERAGASEVGLDNQFARELGIQQFGSEEGTFGGGKKAPFQHGRIDSLTLGDWELKNLPVVTYDPGKTDRKAVEGMGGLRKDREFCRNGLLLQSISQQAAIIQQRVSRSDDDKCRRQAAQIRV